jgi:hypothetical protein
MWHASDALEYYSSRLAYYTDYGPPGHEDFVGVGALSTRPFVNADEDDAAKYIPLPKPDDDPDQVALNRFMVISKVSDCLASSQSLIKPVV